MILNESKRLLDNLGSIWHHSEPSEVHKPVSSQVHFLGTRRNKATLVPKPSLNKQKHYNFFSDCGR